MSFFYSQIIGILFKVNIIFGLLSFIIYLVIMTDNRKYAKFHSIMNIITDSLLFVSLALMTYILGYRWYESGHIPMSNMYETMLVMSWIILIICILVRKKFDIFRVCGLLLSGLIIMVAVKSGMNSQMGKLLPVLVSPWLSIHVSIIMISYSLFAMMMFIGIAALIIKLVVKSSDKRVVLISDMQTMSMIMQYPAVILLSLGIIAGAVWANQSWGKYWGWDPKEVWALVTLLIYCFPLHSNILKRFQNPTFYHIYMLIAFLSILVTYFGVQLFFGGIHAE